MNALPVPDILQAEVDLLLSVEPILIASVSVLVTVVVYGVWRLCAGCTSTGKVQPALSCEGSAG